MKYHNNLDIHLNSSSEGVGSGHPDKIADKIADLILDDAVLHDANSRVACEVLVSNNLVVIAGEVSTKHKINFKQIASDYLICLGYEIDDFKFVINIKTQSSDISNSVDTTGGIGSGDQGVAFGFACVGKNFLPLSYVISIWLVQEAESLIDSGVFWWAKRDMKSLVSTDGKTIKNLIFSIQHIPSITHEELVGFVQSFLIEPLYEKFQISDIQNIFINSSGRFVIGGLTADTGLTNRKLMVDSYGGVCRHGGGGFSGKDFSKVDRLGPYYARWIAKNLVSAGICQWVEIKLIFSLGCKKSIEYSCLSDSEKLTNATLLKLVECVFPLQIGEIISIFFEKYIKFSQLSVYGHFGNPNYPWEQEDKVQQIQSFFNS